MLFSLQMTLPDFVSVTVGLVVAPSGFTQGRTWQRMGKGPHKRNRWELIETWCSWGRGCGRFCPWNIL